ncbi:multicopper oxidase family protein [Paenibacillus piri]|uniref:Multicopper oxidase family protein n=1 Tax=Paenibacillus piri TaxID=2547395 RepID=A0A4R5K8L6_9BACL|nr:multicopper oxidase family protein [Paenibacillus piri]TDF91306.1 multicopper oxidase family protein [Paenibacillus piri]
MILIIADLAMIFLLFVIWGIAGYRSSHLLSLPTKSRVRSSVRGIIVLFGIGVLLLLGKIVTSSLLASKGWLFIQDTIILQSVLVVIPIVSVLVFSVPRLQKIARREITNLEQPMDVTDRAAFSTPALILPIQAVGFGTAMELILSLFFPAQSMEWSNLVIILMIFAAVTGVLWVIQRRRGRTEGHSDNRQGQNLLWISASVLLGIIVVSSWFVLSSQSSRIPDRMSMTMGKMDFGRGAVTTEHHMNGMNHTVSGDGKTVSVTDLVGPQTGVPDKKFTLTALKKTIQLNSGSTIDAWTYNGQSPGPELRVNQGDLVEVTLVNKDIDEGVTIHWHGQDVPNGEDGVSGLTQDAVMPGQAFTYRFHANQVGSYWYHSHQQSSEQVQKGLFGAFIVEPKESLQSETQDIVVMTHRWNDTNESAADLLDTLEGRKIAPGSPLRFRLINTDNKPTSFFLSGVKFKVSAIDGTDLNAPADLENARLEVAAGGRYDVTFIMPEQPVLLSIGSSANHILLSADGNGATPEVVKGPVLDPLLYGSPKTTPFGLDSRFDREFVMVIDNKLGFFDGKFGRLHTFNGEVFPNTPMFMVKEGDLVKTTFVNRSFVPHPMHLHGHKMLVLSRNGKTASGSPWWTDTLNVNPGEIYEVAFRADNPGIWMDHCHNLIHAAEGMTLHLAYEGVTTPFEVGHATINKPE